MPAPDRIERIEQGTPLAPFTTFGVGGPAECLARPDGPEEAADLVARARKDGAELRVLGAGSNVLVSDDGVKGTVLLLASPPFKHLARVGDDTVQVGAGGRLARLVHALADWGLAGGEGLSGIPGTVGGALRMNAGTGEGDIGPLVKKAWTLDEEGKPETLSGAECEFGYRTSGLSVGGRIVLGAELELARGDPAEIRSRTVSLLARRRETQPHGVRTAGCVFKNPENPDDPSGETAGKLLDELGLKGLEHGGARVSPVHANFVEAQKGATAADVKWLVDEMRRRAREERGLDLELELALWGFEE